ncbi:MAG: mechanosensitive ion channel family protein [Nanoarchaeota archaeon]|nr:mechanosensitive ion channel family protein [Nanoarchaeota archaeon]MBU1269086.1 mechanosensitive ion channel family protein [Nanoarchaeota archaeon]MBU1604942.1 mechanosensitive ion channel family protein [Nanoarchaeota archaeon]MBU2442821.1 mechanosensitive ion channel family protein [Nanoarchaeota archaeon]
MWQSILNTIDKIIMIIVIIVLTFIIVQIVKRIVKRALERSSSLMKVDPTHYNFLRHFLSAIIYILGLSAIIYTIPSLRTLSVSIFAGAGVLAIIIGFASQQAFANIVSGVFIVIFKPFRVGDRVNVGTDVAGIVEDITLRHTVIRTFENKRVIIPNSKISEENIENSHLNDEKICKYIEFGISYDSNIDKAMKIMREEAMKHPNFLDNRSEEDLEKGDVPAVNVRVVGFGDSSVNLKAWVWAENPAKAFVLGCDLNKSIKERFDKAGIEIPYPHRTIVRKK